MDYKKHYDNLMEKAKNRIIPKEIYTERHHILPRCMGGSNKKENIVRLLPREHYISHLLLFNMYPNNNKLAYAFWMMCNGYRKNERKYIVSGRIYEDIRNKFIELNKQKEPFFKGKKHTEESKLKNSLAHKGIATWINKKHTEESKIKMSKAALGRKLSEETRKKMSDSKKGIKFSEETRKKMSENTKGENNNYTKYLKKTGLPHCNSIQIEQYTIDNQFIKNWENGLKAAIALGINYKAINQCLRGKTKTSGGFIWKYKKNSLS
jgi:hypothetical protein